MFNWKFWKKKPITEKDIEKSKEDFSKKVEAEMVITSNTIEINKQLESDKYNQVKAAYYRNLKPAVLETTSGRVPSKKLTEVNKPKTEEKKKRPQDDSSSDFVTGAVIGALVTNSYESSADSRSENSGYSQSSGDYSGGGSTTNDSSSTDSGSSGGGSSE